MQGSLLKFWARRVYDLGGVPSRRRLSDTWGRLGF